VRLDVARDLSESAQAFVSVVWPSLSGTVRSGEFLPMEAVDACGLAKDFDVLAGIDAWQKLPGVGIRGIASRVQFCLEPWDTFTIRYERDSGAETEFAKRLSAIRDNGGWLYPSLTIQGYVARADGGFALLSAAVVRTKDLFLYAEKCLPNTSRGTVYFQQNDRAKIGDANKFLVCPWDNMLRAGVKLGIAPRGYLARKYAWPCHQPHGGAQPLGRGRMGGF